MRLLSTMLKTCFWEAFSIDMVCPPQYKVTVALSSGALLSSCDHIRQRIHWVACYSLTDWNFKMGKRNHMFYDRAEREAQVVAWSPEDARCSLAPVYVYDVCDHFREQLDSTQSDPSQPYCRSCILPFYSWRRKPLGLLSKLFSYAVYVQDPTSGSPWMKQWGCMPCVHLSE